MSENTTKLRIHFACLASYNNGILHGKWIDFPCDNVWEQINELLETSPVEDADEWTIEEYEGFEDLEEYEDLDEINELAKYKEEHGLDCINAYIYCSYYLSKRDFKNAYHGNYSDTTDPELEFAKHLFNERYVYSIAENLRFNIDYEAFKNDLFINDYISRNGYIFKRKCG